MLTIAPQSEIFPRAGAFLLKNFGLSVDGSGGQQIESSAVDSSSGGCYLRFSLLMLMNK